MENQTSTMAPKSNFITVFSWIMIIINGFTLFISLMQNLIFAFFFSIDEFQSAFNDTSDFPKGFPTFMLKNIRWLLPAMGILILFAFLSSIGLLHRKEWARKAFLFLLGFGIIYITAASIFQFFFMRSFFGTSDVPSEFNLISTFFSIFMIVLSVGFIILFVWLFKKLSSDKIKEEFMQPELEK